MTRNFLARFVLVGLVVAAFLPASAAAEQSGEAVFHPGDPFNVFVVPEGVHDIRVTARGASGAQVRKTGESGHGAIASGSFTVTPGEWLWIVVANGDGDGYGEGGAHGKVAGSPHDGAAGGGGSSVESGYETMVIAGGGGGGGGDNDAIGGAGGDAEMDGRPGNFIEYGEIVNEQIEPGRGGYESGGDGGDGDSDHNPDLAGGGGGGGGGGARGGSGGEHGYTFRSHDIEESGAGGGGGTSYINPDAFGPNIETDSQCVSNGTPSAACEGLVILSWGAPPAQVSAILGAGQAAPLTAGFNPIAVRATDANGVPVSAVPVTFSVPGTGPSGVLPGGQPTVVVETNEAGVATLHGLVSTGPVGAWNLTASAPGGIATQVSLTSQPIPVEVALAVAPSPSTAAEALEISAQVTGTVGEKPLPPTGAVQFAIDEVPIGDAVPLDPSTGTAQLPAGSAPFLLPGGHTVTADYLGDASHAAESARQFQAVEHAPVAVTVDGMPNPVSDGSKLDLRATVTTQTAGPLPTGTVSFFSDGDPVGMVPLDSGGVATLSLGSLPLGTHSITAIYVGDERFAASVGEAFEVVDDAAVAAILSSAANPSTFGAGVLVEAEIRRAEPGPTPDGTVDFTVDGDPACSGVQTNAAVATCELPSELAAGSHGVRASFDPAVGSGDAAATGALVQVVVPAPTRDELTVDPGSAIFDQAFALGSTVLRGDGADATGSVQFQLDRFEAASPLALGSGRAELADACAGAAPGGDCPLGVGVHTVLSEFLPADGNLRPSHATAFIQVVPEPTEAGVRLSAPSAAGVPASFLATAVAPSGAAEGSVQFLLDGTVLGAPVSLVDGSAESRPTRPLAPGPHKVVAHYLGAERFDPAESHLDFAAGDSSASPRLRVLSRKARVEPDGTLRIRAACDGAAGTACEGRLYLRLPVGTSKKDSPQLLARAYLKIEAGSTGAPRLSLRSSGRQMLSTRPTLEARARFGGQGADARLRLRSTEAPRLVPESVHRSYRAFVVRFSCLPPAHSSMRGCDAAVALSADGHRLGAFRVAANRAGPIAARLPLPASYRYGADAEVRVRVRSEVAVGEARTSTTSFAVRPRVLGSRAPARP
jgi:hypothetical protein